MCEVEEVGRGRVGGVVEKREGEGGVVDGGDV